MTQTLMPGSFGYGNSVKYVINTTTYSSEEITGTVSARVLNSDLYVVLFDKSILTEHGRYKKYIELAFGNPNRHLPLQWGKYYGYYNEFIVPAKELTLAR